MLFTLRVRLSPRIAPRSFDAGVRESGLSLIAADLKPATDVRSAVAIDYKVRGVLGGTSANADEAVRAAGRRLHNLLPAQSTEVFTQTGAATSATSSFGLRVAQEFRLDIMLGSDADPEFVANATIHLINALSAVHIGKGGGGLVVDAEATRASRVRIDVVEEPITGAPPLRMSLILVEHGSDGAVGHYVIAGRLVNTASAEGPSNKRIACVLPERSTQLEDRTIERAGEVEVRRLLLIKARGQLEGAYLELMDRARKHVTDFPLAGEFAGRSVAAEWLDLLRMRRDEGTRLVRFHAKTLGERAMILTTMQGGRLVEGQAAPSS